MREVEDSQCQGQAKDQRESNKRLVYLAFLEDEVDCLCPDEYEVQDEMNEGINTYNASTDDGQ